MSVLVGHGTLDVVLATRGCIVMATDSRRTVRAGAITDNTRKLFRLSGNRFVAISGLVDAVLEGFPELTLQIPALLETAIEMDGGLDMHHWEDTPPPSDMPAKFAAYWGRDPYMWWNLLAGPLQTLFGIAATFNPASASDVTGLVGIVAGYKSNGEPRIDELHHKPITGVSNWGRPSVASKRGARRIAFMEPLTSRTVGATTLADLVLQGKVDSELRATLGGYEGISNFLRVQERNALPSLSEADLRALAVDLVRATAERYPGVGKEPIQFATIHPDGRVEYDQPIASLPTLGLTLEGTWHSGVVFTKEYPFATARRGVVFTTCSIVANESSIPLGDNYFYGCDFANAHFHYDGGMVHFGDNNSLVDCDLTLVSGTDEGAVRGIIGKFARVSNQ